DSTYVLGIDEHTGIVIDIDADSASVVGKGVVTLRLRDGSTEISSGETFPLDRLRNPKSTATTSRPAAAPTPVVEQVADSNLRQATERLAADFDAALRGQRRRCGARGAGTRRRDHQLVGGHPAGNGRRIRPSNASLDDHPSRGSRIEWTH
ncbi:MAG: hypothetical protein EBQ75_03970, partial [Actinobacteria bacterium]|nr:hypothetical protein [Actinomycetota bacterium]